MKNSWKVVDANQDWQRHILTPPSRNALPVAIQSCQGKVQQADNLLTSDNPPVRLEFTQGGPQPVVILDLGPSSPGGYPVFKVKSATGNPVVRLSYTDMLEHILDPVHGERGDFQRGKCKYLGVELPVPPANPYRYELYTVTGPGTYISPMVQGQQRWVRIQLDSENTSVEIESFYLVGVSDRSPHAGHFLCNDEDLTRLWYSSTYTCQISSIENADAWTIIEGWLAPRALAKANEVGLSRKGRQWTDYSVEFSCRIMRNPGPVSAVGWVVRAQDPDNGYVFQLDLDSRLHVRKRSAGAYTYLKPVAALETRIIDNKAYAIRCVVSGPRMETYLDGVLIDVTEDASYQKGKVGFCQPLDKWALVQNVRVTAPDGKTLLKDDFKRDLTKWDFVRTKPFVADGAKRDRLPWIGDLDWAGRNIYYAFKDPIYMTESLRMFAFHQTAEGYVWATCYPENRKKPAIGEYGYYQSDLFSAWFIPTVADHLLFTGDKAFAAEMYPVVKHDADYLWSYVEADGLHYQRYNTSKGLWSHELEDVGRFAYNNILIYDAMEETAFMADVLGFGSDAIEMRRRGSIMKAAIMKAFWNDAEGYFMEERDSKKPCFMAGSLAIAISFLDPVKARKAAAYLSKTEYWHGKVVSLTIRGNYEYGFDELGMSRLRKPMGPVNWLDAIKDPRCPGTTTECMTYPYKVDAGPNNWGDNSHPDTAMAHILTGYMLGVQPTSPGFATCSIVPHTHGLTWAKGSVPTPHGDIICSWEQPDEATGTFECTLTLPPAVTAIVGVPLGSGAFKVSLNGRIVFDTAVGFAPAVSGRRDERYVYLDAIRGGSHVLRREA